MRHSNKEECETGEACWCVRHACHSGQPARSAPLVHRCNQRRRFALEPRRSFLSDAVQMVRCSHRVSRRHQAKLSLVFG